MDWGCSQPLQHIRKVPPQTGIPRGLTHQRDQQNHMAQRIAEEGGGLQRPGGHRFNGPVTFLQEAQLDLLLLALIRRGRSQQILLHRDDLTAEPINLHEQHLLLLHHLLMKQEHRHRKTENLEQQHQCQQLEIGLAPMLIGVPGVNCLGGRAYLIVAGHRSVERQE